MRQLEHCPGIPVDLFLPVIGVHEDEIERVAVRKRLDRPDVPVDSLGQGTSAIDGTVVLEDVDGGDARGVGRVRRQYERGVALEAAHLEHAPGSSHGGDLREGDEIFQRAGPAVRGHGGDGHGSAVEPGESVLGNDDGECEAVVAPHATCGLREPRLA